MGLVGPVQVGSGICQEDEMGATVGQATWNSCDVHGVWLPGL